MPNGTHRTVRRSTPSATRPFQRHRAIYRDYSPRTPWEYKLSVTCEDHEVDSKRVRSYRVARIAQMAIETKVTHLGVRKTFTLEIETSVRSDQRRKVGRVEDESDTTAIGVLRPLCPPADDPRQHAVEVGACRNAIASKKPNAGVQCCG